MMGTQKVQKVVILGGGFGGAYCAQRLEKLLGAEEADILLLDGNNYFIFYPLLVEAGTGSLEPRHAVISIRAFLKRVRFRMGAVEKIDLEHRTVTYSVEGEGHEAGYDQLVLALGSVTNTPDIPGLHDYGFVLKSLADAVALRDRAIAALEKANARGSAGLCSELHFVVVGGNFTGAEVAGEFLAFLRQASREYENVAAEDCHVTLVELKDRILSALDADLSAYALQALRKQGVQVFLDNSVVRIEEDTVHLKDGGSLRSNTVIWCAGIAPSPILDHLDLPKDERGYVLCDPSLRVEGHPEVWGIGDCAVNPDPDGRPYAATAQHAIRQGVHLAENLKRVCRADPPQPFVYDSRGSLAALGCRTGVARVGPMKLSGWPAWFLWRTVYLFKMPGWARRLRVALDWSMGLLFRRDFVQLGIHRIRERRSIRKGNHE
jgi:NADH dehydrogenase